MTYLSHLFNTLKQAKGDCERFGIIEDRISAFIASRWILLIALSLVPFRLDADNPWKYIVIGIAISVYFGAMKYSFESLYHGIKDKDVRRISLVTFFFSQALSVLFYILMYFQLKNIF
jgi:hypothetical protein